MKKFTKTLIAVCVCAFLVTGSLLAAFAADEYTGTLDGLAALVDTAEKETNADKKADALIAVADYLEDTPVDPATEGYGDIIDRADAALVDAANLLLKNIDDEIETTLKTASNKVAINKLNRLLDKCELVGDKASLEDVQSSFSALVELHENAVAINLSALESSNSIEDYDLPIYVTEDFETGYSGYTTTKNNRLSKNGSDSIWVVDLKGTDNQIGVETEANGNDYLVSRYTANNTASTYTQISLKQYDASNGYVFEFSIATFGTTPKGNVNVETGSISGAGRFPPPYFYVNSNGDICANDKSTVLFKGAFVEGGWLDVMIAFDPSEFVYNLYIEGEKIGTYNAKLDGKETFDLSECSFRLSGSGEGEIAYDNFKLYSGSNYRDPEKFNKMTDDERFLYYANYLLDDTKNVNGRNVAYELAGELLPKYWDSDNESYTDYASGDAELTAAVDAYNSFDFEELLVIVKSDNLQAYITKVLALESAERTVDTTTTRQTMVSELEKFVTDYSELIDKESDNNGNGEKDYYEYNKIVETVKQEIEFDKNAVFFIRYMSRFENSPTTIAMQRYYNKAKTLVVDESIDLDLVTNSDHEDRANFEEFIAAYETYLASHELLNNVIKKDNSVRIVTCMNFINMYTTEEEWMENYDVMNKYIDIVKEYILYTDDDGTLLYDSTYAGVGEAVSFFNEAYTFFYNIQQEMHISYIQEILDLIGSTEAYVEKMGMISMIDRYVASNDLNYGDQRILTLLNALETYRSELQVREEDYGKILIQNAVYFVNIVENMRTAETYLQQRDYFEQASLLYFNIDITVAGAENAVAIYDSYAIELELIEQSSLAFLEAVDYYRACETADDRYAALVNCYYNAQFAESSYLGVEEAMEEFESEYEAYMNYVETVNEEIVATGNAVGSLRSNCGITPIIAVIIKKIFGV